MIATRALGAFGTVISGAWPASTFLLEMECLDGQDVAPWYRGTSY